MTKLSVNINKIATLRNTRPQINIPDLLHLSKIAIEAGADGITIHPRPDERHIRADDVRQLAEFLTSYPTVEFNIEGNPFEGRYLEQCFAVRPTQCTLVPDTVSQSTSDHGWNLARDGDRLKPVIEILRKCGIRVSLFMDPIPSEIRLLGQIGADRVELYTEPYAARHALGNPNATEDYCQAAIEATKLGMGINAGHDLNLNNLTNFLSQVPKVLEVSIGHALIAESIEFGLAATVKKYQSICRSHDGSNLTSPSPRIRGECAGG